MAFQKYFSGYLVNSYAFYKPPPFVGKGWHITFDEVDNPHKTSMTLFDATNHISYPSKAVVINASSLERAQYVSELLYASSCLQSGSLPFIEKLEAYLMDASDNSQQELWPGASYGSIPLSCMIAAKVSFKKEYQYALFKHLASHELMSSETMDHNPSDWMPSKFVRMSVDYHVKCAHAIVIAYSVIEELSFELRATNKTPSFVDRKWNPIVKADLENRLKSAGINLSETFLWELRDTPTKIERARQPRIQSKASWAYGKIRDGEVDIVDAIAQASWLRSKVSAHKLRELASALNYYEVYNVQHLARRLLLEKMGMWRYSGRSDE
jgi:hypothetical protein